MIVQSTVTGAGYDCSVNHDKRGGMIVQSTMMGVEV